MGSSIHQVLRGWTRAWNRRRGAEELLRAGAFALGAAAVAGVVGAVFGAGWWVVPPLLAFWALTAIVAVFRALWRQTTPLALAYRVDAARGTADLLATALATETGRATGAAPLRAAVVHEALRAAPDLAGDRLGPVVLPMRSLGLAVFLTLVSGPLTVSALIGWDPLDALAAVTTRDPAEALDAAMRETLAADAEALAQAEERTPGLSREARQALRQAREKLASAATEGRPAEQVGEDLADARERLEELERAAREEGLLDPAELAKEDTKTLKEALEDAISKGDGATAEALAEELERRQGEGGARAQGVSELAKDLAERRSESGTAGTGSRPDLSELARELAERSADARDAAGSGETREPSAREAISRALADAREAGEMAERGDPGEAGDRGEPGEKAGDKAGEKPGDKPGSKPGKGPGKTARGEGPGTGGEKGEGPARPGKGPPKDGPGSGFAMGGTPGKGGTTPGPGGDDHSGKAGFDPWGGTPPADWVATQWSDSSEVVVSAIEKSAHGERSSVEYAEVHRGYEAIAESAVQTEEIPLTRRDYIRAYFEEIRPQ